MSCYQCNCYPCSCEEDNFIPEKTNKNTTIPITGVKGDRYVKLYAKSNSNIIPPTITNIPNPAGWSLQLPVVEENEYVWYVIGWVNYSGTVLTVNWSTPALEEVLITAPVFLEDLI